MLALLQQVRAGGEPEGWQLLKAVSPILGDLLDEWHFLERRARTVRSRIADRSQRLGLKKRAGKLGSRRKKWSAGRSAGSSGGPMVPPWGV